MLHEKGKQVLPFINYKSEYFLQFIFKTELKLLILRIVSLDFLFYSN